jgi:protein-S-isoprenylcysteine O-methyltransferase Ste14
MCSRKDDKPDHSVLNSHTFRQKLFQYRSYTPIPFLVIMLVFAEPDSRTMIVGFILAIFGEFLRFWGVAYAGSLTRVTGGVGAPEVIVSGPYAHVRNPLYLGNTFLYVGIGVMSNALFPWLLVVAAFYFAFQYYQIVILEEGFLRQSFGAAYDNFSNNVPRFLPRLTPYQDEAQAHQRPDWRSALRSEKRSLQAFALVLIVLLVIWLRR